ncbi:MAG TPA: hypothetical protein PKN45_11545, partial [Candidatus Limiplasma sp.]|nr:hypothetical protein [Candidatus Limiplasma sp.]
MRTLKAFLKKNWMIVLGLTLSVATILTFFLLTDGITVLKEISKSLQYGWLLVAAGFVLLQWAFDSL